MSHSWISASEGCREQFFHCGLQYGLQWNLSSGAWSISCLSLLTSESAGLLLSHIVIPLFSGFNCFCAITFSLLKSVPTEVPVLLVGLALDSSGSVLDPTGISPATHGGSFWQILTETAPASPLLLKPCHTNPTQEVYTYSNENIVNLAKFPEGKMGKKNKYFVNIYHLLSVYLFSSMMKNSSFSLSFDISYLTTTHFILLGIGIDLLVLDNSFSYNFN